MAEHVRCYCLFDAFGTLIYPEPNAALVYHRAGQQFGDRRSPSVIRDLLKQQIRHVLGSHVGGATSPEIERDRWRTVVQGVFGELPNWPSLFDFLWNYFSLPEHWRVFDDVGETLRQLREGGMELGIASNFDARLYSICRGLRPISEINRVFVSAELGWRKPSSEFFQAIADRLGVSPNQLWMVGDDLEFDVHPAQQSGWRSIHLDRRQSDPTTTFLDQTIRINSLSQLPALLLS